MTVRVLVIGDASDLPDALRPLLLGSVRKAVDIAPAIRSFRLATEGDAPVLVFFAGDESLERLALNACWDVKPHAVLIRRHPDGIGLQRVLYASGGKVRHATYTLRRPRT